MGPRHSPSPPPCKSPVQAESPCQQLYPVVTGTGSLPSPCTRLSSPTLQEPSLSPSGSPFLGPPSPSHSHRHTEAMTYHECQSFPRVVAEGRLARLVIGRLRHSQNTRPHWAAAPPGLEGPPHSTIRVAGAADSHRVPGQQGGGGKTRPTADGSVPTSAWLSSSPGGRGRCWVGVQEPVFILFFNCRKHQRLIRVEKKGNESLSPVEQLPTINSGPSAPHLTPLSPTAQGLGSHNYLSVPSKRQRLLLKTEP